MRIYKRNIFWSPSKIFTNRITSDVINALNINTQGNKFVGNDTLWFQKNPTGKITPTALNSAHFISKTFQENLKKLGWDIEKTIDDQTFDAYFEKKVSAKVFRPSKKDFPKIIEKIWKIKRKSYEYPIVLMRAWRELIKIVFKIQYKKIPKNLYSLFPVNSKKKILRVGLEFETGNIASCFRSINKLGILYKENHIDFGILVTFRNKANSACRLFPTSNRNGSFEELDSRKFSKMVDYPLWEVAFEPDSFSKKALYLGSKPNELFEPKFIKNEIINDIKYECFRSHDGRDLFRKKKND